MNNFSPNYSTFLQADSQTLRIYLINETITKIKVDDNSFKVYKDVNFSMKYTNKKKLIQSISANIRVN